MDRKIVVSILHVLLCIVLPVGPHSALRGGQTVSQYAKPVLVRRFSIGSSLVRSSTGPHRDGIECFTASQGHAAFILYNTDSANTKILMETDIEGTRLWSVSIGGENVFDVAIDSSGTTWLLSAPIEGDTHVRLFSGDGSSLSDKPVQRNLWKLVALDNDVIGVGRDGSLSSLSPQTGGLHPSLPS